MNHKNKIYYWSPHLVNVATRRAVINSAYSIKKYSKNFECSIINFFGEFNLFKDEILNKKVNLINYFNPKILNFLPKYGKIKSRFSYLVIFVFSFLPLKKLIDKDRPDYFIIHLITSLPLILLMIFKFKTKFVLRISGLPKMNFLRRLLWKIALKKIFIVTCPTKITCDYIKSLKIVDENKVKLLYDPVINVREITKKIKMKSEIISKHSNYFFSAGRLTKQKNFLFLCETFNKFLEINPNYKLLIAGEGEERKVLTEFIKKNSLEKKIILLGKSRRKFVKIEKVRKIQ